MTAGMIPCSGKGLNASISDASPSTCSVWPVMKPALRLLSFRLAHGPRPASLSPKRLAAARFEIQTVLPRAALTNAGLA